MKNDFRISVKEIKEIIISQDLKNEDEILIENGELFTAKKYLT